MTPNALKELPGSLRDSLLIGQREREAASRGFDVARYGDGPTGLRTEYTLRKTSGPGCTVALAPEIRQECASAVSS